MSKFLGVAAMLLGLGGASAALACPDYQQYGQQYQLTGKQMYDKVSFSVAAGGDNFIRNCRNVQPRTDRGDGWVTTAPDFSLNLTGMNRYQLVLSVVSECDSVLLINTGSVNWYYDDDDNGNLDARISLTRPSDGWLDVWVGTHDGQVCNATLYLETFNR